MSVTDIQELAKLNEGLAVKVTKVEKDISDVKKSVFRIEQGLFGDNDISHDGALKTLRELRCLYSDIAAKVEDMRVVKQNEDSLIKNNKWWLAAIASLTGGTIVWVLNLLTRHL